MTVASGRREARGTPSEPTIKGLVVSRGDDIEIEKCQLVWKNVLARGVHTAMAGEGGGGKSQVTYNIAAAITNGGTLPEIDRSADKATSSSSMPRIAPARCSARD